MASSAQSLGPSANQSARILLVDDEPLILSSYRRALSDTQNEIFLAQGANEGLAVLEQQTFDVVLADYRMPQMNGDVFLEHVRDRWPTTVRLLVTACTDVQIFEDVVKRGEIYRFLTKPCLPDKLRSALDDAVDHGRDLQRQSVYTAKAQLDLASFRKMFMSAPQPMMIADLSGRLVDVNEAFVQAGGGDRGHALNHRPHVLPGTTVSVDAWSAVCREISRTGRWSREIDDGQGGVALLNISVLHKAEGTPYAYAATQTDLTARKQLELQTRSAQYEIVLALARLAEYRDPETGAHLERMQRYARILAQHLARNPRYQRLIDEEYLDALYYSAPVHDIGKVGIPDAILLKPGPLTPAERAIMEEHTLIGHDVLRGSGHSLPESNWLALARVIALQHHEKVDGSGYPLGLKGDQIDLSARIVAVADAYDAITSKRVYKPALSREVAKQRIIEAAGTHFDLDVVDTFLSAETDFVQVMEAYPAPESEKAPLVKQLHQRYARVARND
jgi:PAS domain S-box-containing protein